MSATERWTLDAFMGPHPRRKQPWIDYRTGPGDIIRSETRIERGPHPGGNIFEGMDAAAIDEAMRALHAVIHRDQGEPTT